MPAASVTLGFLADVALGVFLLAAAGLLARAWRRPGRMPLAVYVGLVGLNYGLNGLRQALTLPSLVERGLLQASSAATVLDPPFLLLFALASAGIRVPRALTFALVAPAAALLAVFLLGPPSWFGEVQTFHLCLAYAAAFGLLLAALLRAKDAPRVEALAALALAAGVVVLPRIPLAYIDLGLARFAEGRAQPSTLLALEGGLLAIYALAWLAVLIAPATPGRTRARDVLASLAGLLVIVEFVWLLRFFPPFQAPAFALLYSSRWFVFSALLVVGARRHDLLGNPDVVGPTARRGFTFLVVGLVGSAVASLLAALEGQTPSRAILGGLVVVGAGLAATTAFRRAVGAPDDLAWRRVAIYSAHVELGASPEELERLRASLGMSEREAEEVRALVAAARETAAPAIREGALLAGRYEVEALVGAGAFGRVWRARDRATGERVTLKELLSAWQEDAEAVARFRHEVEAAMRLRHPNLVQFRGLERSGNGHVLVLAHVEGETLRDRVARAGPLLEREARVLASGLLDALAALHEAGLVHRDVKPENVILRPDGSPVLIDLGAAGDGRGGGGTRLSGGRAHPGTPGYMSPEQARGDPLGPPADLYSAGLVLWEATTGRTYPRGAPPPEWRAVLARALAPDPAERWAGAGEFRAAIDAGLLAPEGG